MTNDLQRLELLKAKPFISASEVLELLPLSPSRFRQLDREGKTDGLFFRMYGIRCCTPAAAFEWFEKLGREQSEGGK